MEYDNLMENRVKRMEGELQLRGIYKMMDVNKDCKEVVTQLSAVRVAVDRPIGLVVSTNLVKCVLETNKEEGADDLIKRC